MKRARPGLARGAGLLLAFVAAAFVACLNPRPEDDPSLIDAVDPGAGTDNGIPGSGTEIQGPASTDDDAPPPSSGAGGSGTATPGSPPRNPGPDAGVASDSRPSCDPGAGGDAGTDAGLGGDAAAP